MLYNNFQDIKISALAMGNMRLPILDGDNSKIDEELTGKMIDYAMAHGINYYDTAWGYHDGQSELAVGRALKKHPRDSFYLATKFPGYDLRNMDKVEEIFEQQLVKCGVDYFDFYLVHNVCEMNIDAYLDPKFGIYDYLVKQKENGRIRHLGFSAHGSVETIQRFMDVYGKSMEFCQLQLNYLDWEFQNAKGKVALMTKYNIPIWVMEPLRGGKLANLTEAQSAKLKALRPEEGIPAWAFRYLQGIPQVVTALSGMSDLQQLMDNIATYETHNPLNEAEQQALQEVVDEMLEKVVLPCTKCRYCTTHCPQGLDIPDLIELYNEHTVTGGGFIAPMRIRSMPDEKKPNACIACRSCEAVCPQQIHIADALADFSKKLGL